MRKVHLWGGPRFDQTEKNNVESMARNFGQDYTGMFAILGCVERLYSLLQMGNFHHSDCAYQNPTPVNGYKFELVEIRSPHLWHKEDSNLKKLIDAMTVDNRNFTIRQEMKVEPVHNHKDVGDRLLLGKVYGPEKEEVFRYRIQPFFRRILAKRSERKDEGVLERNFLHVKLSSNYQLLYAKVDPRGNFAPAGCWYDQK